MNTNLTFSAELTPVSLPDLSKAQLLDYADTLVTTYADEGQDLIGLAILSAKLELLSQRIKDRAKSAALTDVLHYGKGGVLKLGVHLTVKETGVTYDYSLDSVWQVLNQAVVDATAKRKLQEELLKKLPYEGRIMTDESTGELYRAYPPAKTGSEGVMISIK